MKYAIVESGGKQYKAVEGGTIEVDRLALEVGQEIELEDVLLISNDGEVVVGSPTVDGATIAATVVAQFKGPKIIVFKYKSRQRYRVKQGHRQKYTRLMIDQILAKGEKKSEAKKAEKPAEEEKPAAEEKPKAEAKPKTAAKTKTAAKPKTAAKTKTSTKKAATKTSTKKSEKKSE